MWARDWQTFNGPTHLLLHANTKLRHVSSKLWYTTSQTHWRNSAKEFLFTQSQRGIQKIVKLLEEARKITEENQDYAAVYTFGKKLILLISEKLSSMDEYSVLVKSCPIQTGETASSLQSSFKDKWLGFISLFGHRKDGPRSLSPSYLSSSAPQPTCPPSPATSSNKISIRDFQILKLISRGAFG